MGAGHAEAFPVTLFWCVVGGDVLTGVVRYESGLFDR